MFIKIEELLIGALGDTTLVHLLCVVVLLAICGLEKGFDEEKAFVTIASPRQRERSHVSERCL